MMKCKIMHAFSNQDYGNTEHPTSLR